MILFLLSLFTAIALSGIAAYFSVIGLIAIFAAAPIPIMVMGGALEVAKLVTASWVYRHWSIAPRILRYYFTIAVIILTLITSMGIFGYLSKAHMDQTLPSGDVVSKIQLIDEKISIERSNIEQARKDLFQLNTQIDKFNELGAVSKGVTVRRQQQTERNNLMKQISAGQDTINKLNLEKAPLSSQLRKVEAEVGPLKYIAALVYGDNPESNLLERTVRWVIITLVFVFDPLAILLLIASSFSFRLLKGEIITPVAEPSAAVTEFKAEEEPVTNFFGYPTPSVEVVTPPEPPVKQETPKPEKEGWAIELYRRVRQEVPAIFRKKT